MSLLTDKNKHPFDERIKFQDEGHKYWIDGNDKDLISSTTFIHTFFGHFDSEKMINNILKSKKYNDPDYKYYKMTGEEIKKQWDDSGFNARTEGTKMHKDIEDFYNEIEVDNESEEFEQFLKFYKDHEDLEIYRTEWLIFSDLLKITGSIDATFINKDGTLSLGDWKRSKEITKESYGGQCGKFPLQHIPDSNYYHYSLQLNLYRTILERFYGMKVKEMFLVALHPENKNEYKKIFVDKMDKEIEMMLDHRKQELIKKGYTLESLNALKFKHTLKDAVCNEEDIIEEEVKPIKSFLRNTKKEDKKSFKKEDTPIKSFLKNMKKEEESIVLEPEERKMIKLDNLSYKFLSEKQKSAYNILRNGFNLFLTGKGGCGKSAIINLFYKEQKSRKNIVKTSTTGTSAILIGGTTLHSYLGIGLGKGEVEFMYMNIKNKPHILKRWLDLEILIIDEISMLSPDLFDKLEELARVIRRNDLPFGDIQLILSGDFLQLPCVGSKKFCFEAKSWDKCVKHVSYLTENFRQNDIEFQNCLSEVRIANLSNESVNLLKSRIGIKLQNELGILPTKIYALNKDVDTENKVEIGKLFKDNSDLDFFEYNMEYKILKKTFKDPEELASKGCNAPGTLELCAGAQVMLLYNMDLDAKLANGSRGVVIKFIDDLPVVRFLTGEERIIDYHSWKIQENGVDVLEITQIPLKIAYAISVHKSQGITVDYAEIDMEGIFEDGMAYVALSRVTSLNGLSLKNFRLGNIFANEKAVEFYKNL